ncbi:hypothetical protein SAMD00019534_084660, partial [Acytostelium subglobosum LB1]|uniref:hypothetical protein n=1 Tax=Acytostelium subglobosum LB1 TaxID=1410327 RepID=UPI000644D21B
DWEAVIVQSAYTLIHLVIYVILLFRTGTDLNKAVFTDKDKDYTYLIWTHSLFALTFITYFIAANKRPGCIIRSKHCKRCNACILKYDHHCFFIGQCVGLHNHKAFCLFLLVQTLLLALGFQITLSGIHSAESPMDWVKANIAMWLPTVLTFASSFMPFGLLCYHIYLIVTNQTSWEAQKYDRITYLKRCKGMPYPFSKGVTKNIASFWTENKGSPYWTLPSPADIQRYKDDKKRRTQTWLYRLWKNEYYSCC